MKRKISGCGEFRKQSQKNMNAEQAEFVRKALSDISSAQWGTEEGTKAIRAAFGSNFTTAAKQLFGAKQAVYMFGVTSNLDMLTPESCSCNTTSDFCGAPYECRGGGCELTEWGCGALLYFQCSGKCRNILIE